MRAMPSFIRPAHSVLVSYYAVVNLVLLIPLILPISEQPIPSEIPTPKKLGHPSSRKKKRKKKGQRVHSQTANRRPQPQLNPESGGPGGTRTRETTGRAKIGRSPQIATQGPTTGSNKGLIIRSYFAITTSKYEVTADDRAPRQLAAMTVVAAE